MGMGEKHCNFAIDPIAKLRFLEGGSGVKALAGLRQTKSLLPAEDLIDRRHRGERFGHSAGWFSLAGKIVELHGTIGFKGGLNGMQM